MKSMQKLLMRNAQKNVVLRSDARNFSCWYQHAKATGDILIIYRYLSTDTGNVINSLV